MATQETSSCFVKLSINSVRRCYSYSPLGFVAPQSLGRGLSIKSLKLGGGPVFAVRVRVLMIVPQMVKVTAQSAEGDKQKNIKVRHSH